MKKVITGLLISLVLMGSFTAQSYFDASSFDDLSIIKEDTSGISDVELELLLRSIIKSELEASSSKQEDEEKKIEAEIDRRVNEEMKKYRAAGEEYIADLTREMEQKTEDEILEIKTNYSLKLAEERMKLKDEYDEKLKEQKVLSDLALLEALDEERQNAELKRMAELTQLQYDMDLRQSQKDHPLEYAELFITDTNPNDNGTVYIANKDTRYSGKTYRALSYKGNTGKPANDWNSWYNANLTSNIVEDSSLIKDYKNANTLKFKVIGDGNAYKIILYHWDENNYHSYLYRFSTVEGKVQEFTAHRSQFVSYDSSDELDMSKMNGFMIDYEYGMEGKSRPDANRNFEATLFDFEFLNDSKLENEYFSKKNEPLVYAENYGIAKNSLDNANYYILDTKYTYEGKNYKAINYVGNTGSADKNIDHWYDIAFAKWSGHVTDEMIEKNLRTGKTIKFKVLGDGNTYCFILSYWVNGEYCQFNYNFTTKKGKVTEVKIPVKSLKNYGNSKNLKFDQSKVEEMHIKYEWNKPGMEWQRAPKPNTNFDITIFDFVFF